MSMQCAGQAVAHIAGDALDPALLVLVEPVHAAVVRAGSVGSLLGILLGDRLAAERCARRSSPARRRWPAGTAARAGRASARRPTSRRSAIGIDSPLELRRQPARSGRARRHARRRTPFADVGDRPRRRPANVSDARRPVSNHGDSRTARTTVTHTRLTSASGIITFQARSMSWSKRNRGIVQRTSMMKSDQAATTLHREDQRP